MNLIITSLFTLLTTQECDMALSNPVDRKSSKKQVF